LSIVLLVLRIDGAEGAELETPKESRGEGEVWLLQLIGVRVRTLILAHFLSHKRLQPAHS